MVNEPLPQNVRSWGMFCHIAGAIAAVIGTLTFTPFIFVVLPFIVWRMGRDRHPFIDAQGQTAINFLLSMSIYSVVIGVLSALLAFATCGALASQGQGGATLLGWLFYVYLGGFGLYILFQFGLMLFAGWKAYQGQSYQYPFLLNFLGGGSIQ